MGLSDYSAVFLLISLLALFDKTFFLSGMLMYELHMPIIMLTQMQLQSGLLSRDQVPTLFYD